MEQEEVDRVEADPEDQTIPEVDPLRIIPEVDQCFPNLGAALILATMDLVT